MSPRSVLELPVMSIRQCRRPVLALAVAYGVALQALMLVISVPFAGAAGFAAPICLPGGHGGTAPAPAGHGCDCAAACAAACCGAPTLLLQARIDPAPTGAPGIALEPAPPRHFKTARAHRSRAPPAV